MKVIKDMGYEKIAFSFNTDSPKVTAANGSGNYFILHARAF